MLPRDPRTFSDLLSAIVYVEEEIQEVDIPCVVQYARLFRHYELLRTGGLAGRKEENKRRMSETYLKITSFHPPGPLYKSMSTLRHTLDVMQYKIDEHLLNLLALADNAMEVLSLTDYALAEELGRRD
jgi:hypothetical protein